MADTRSETDKVAGLIPVLWASDDGKGRVVRLRTLKRRKAAEWRSNAAAGLMGLVQNDLSKIGELAQIMDGFSDLALDTLLSYDQDSMLGSREWIEDHVDDSQVYAALLSVLNVAFPFVTDLRGALREIGTLLAIRDQAGGNSAPANSTNGVSPIGDLIPTG